MGNIDEKMLSALLERIDNIKTEFEALENEVRGLLTVTGSEAVTEPVEVTEPAEVTGPAEVTAETPEATGTVTEPAEVTEPVEVTESEEAFDIQTPIEIDLQDIDIPSVIEDPIVEYAVASMVGESCRTTSSATEEIPVTEPEAVTEPGAVTSTGSVTTETHEAHGTATEHNTTVTEHNTTVTEHNTTVTEPVEVTATPESHVTQPDDDLPFDDDLPMDNPFAAPEPTNEPVQEPTLDIEPEIVTKQTPEPDPTPAPKPKTTILDSQKAETAVMDVMAEKQAWRTDRPGSQVKNVISAISLNDRVLLINVLFKEDPLLFQNTISAFNGMSNLEEAITYIQVNFPEWDMNSEPVYRLMMAVRRKLR